MQKLTLNWLKRHIDFYENDLLKLLEKIDDVLTKKGIEVEEMELINGLIVTKINKITKIPQKKVVICNITIDNNLLKLLPYEKNNIQVMTAAENPYEGMHVILAPLNTVINNIKISHRVIQGHDSYGMFCGYNELYNNNSIKCFKESYEKYISEQKPNLVECELPINNIFQYEDVLIKISTPTNRLDLMSVRGIARELAFANLGKLKDLNCFIGNKQFDLKINSEIDTSISFCQVDNIKIDESIKTLLNIIDEKSDLELKYLNDFIMMDIGHPIHIYDSENIKSINLRYAKKDEEFKTLKKNFTCKGNEIIIEMENCPSCVGGMIGIKGFKEDTKNVIIEAGYFQPKNISDNISEASKIFSLGIDNNQETLGYVCSLINGDISNITKTKGSIDHHNKIINLSYSNFFRVSDMAISIEKICNALNNYGFIAKIDRLKRDDHINDEFSIVCQIPSWRTDIKIPEDLIEEILRIIGFDEYTTNEEIKEINNNLKYKDYNQNIRNILINNGFSEMYNFPFSTNGKIKIINSLNINKSYMRNSLLESLLENCNESLAHGGSSCLLFEIGKIYPSEEIKLGILVEGKSQRSWNKKQETYDFFFLKKILLDLSSIIHIDLNSARELNDDLFDFGLSFESGLIGKVKNIDNNKFFNNVFYAEIYINKSKKILKKDDSQTKIYEDLSISIDKNIKFNDIQEALNDFNFYLFDIFPKEQCINYGITFIFNVDVDSKTEIIKIKEILKKFIV